MSCQRCGQPGAPKWSTCASCLKDERWLKIWVALILVIIGAAIFSGMVVHAHVFYGDWTCAFMECRKVVP